jgi:hypothetical protein
MTRHQGSGRGGQNRKYRKAAPATTRGPLTIIDTATGEIRRVANTNATDDARATIAQGDDHRLGR